MKNRGGVVICAAGVGSRLGFNTPKCLIEIDGRPLIYWQLDLLGDFQPIVVVIGFQAQKVMNVVSGKRKDTIFVLNDNYLNTNTLDSLRLGTERLKGSFISLDGDLLITRSALERIDGSPCPTIGIKTTYSDEPVCVTVEQNNNKKMVTSFTRDILDYEWTGLAKIYSEHLQTKTKSKYIYEALENILPINCVTVDCFEIDTLEDYKRATIWTKEKLSSKIFGKKEEVQ